MKQRRYIAWMLMIVSIVMLTASVLPHHHHREILCLQHDVEACGCTCGDHHHHHEATNGHHACDAGCVTKFDLLTQEDAEDNLSPQYSFCSLLYTLADILTIPLPLTDSKAQLSYHYLEKLHSTCLPQVRGLRAPPVA